MNLNQKNIDIKQNVWYYVNILLKGFVSMSFVAALFSFLGIAFVVLLVVLLVWCLVAGVFHGAKIISGYLWWVGAALFWAAVVAIAVLIVRGLFV